MTARLFTSSWAVALRQDAILPVRISVGCPDAAKNLPHVGALAPYGLFGKGLAPDEFEQRYLERLDGYGPDAIRGRLHRIAAESIALCCFEARREDCHRRLTAAWLQAHGFGEVPELDPHQQAGQLSFGDDA